MVEGFLHLSKAQWLRSLSLRQRSLGVSVRAKSAVWVLSVVLAFAVAGRAQEQHQAGVEQTKQGQQQTKAEKIPEVRSTVVVVGTPDPLTEEESPRSTETLEVQRYPLVFTDLNDLMRDDPSVDLEQRGGGGVQADLSIWGSSYEQTLVLLNGWRVNDAETSHFNLDLPVPMQMVGSVNVLHGAGSTLYGSDAVSGVVDFETAKPGMGPQLKALEEGGSFGQDDQAAVASWGAKTWSEVIGGGRDFSDGFMYDRGYRSEEGGSETRAHSVLGDSDVLLGGSDRSFGANQFYGDYNSWERTKEWFAGINQQVNAKTEVVLAYRRHSDIFVLLANDPSYYKNQYDDYSWQGEVRRHDDLPWKGAAIYYGLEANADQIASNNLGDHGRNRGAGYADFELKGKRWGTISGGMREEIFSGGISVATPSAAMSYFVAKKVKLRASVERGFRLPTYVDLYYSDPSTIGNPNLKPESVWNVDGGADWYWSSRLTLTMTVFHSNQTDAIDYVRANASDPWQAENLNGVTFTGVDTGVDWRPMAGQEFRFGLTTLEGAQEALHGLQSEYVFNYPVQNAVAEWIGQYRNGWLLRQRLRVVNRIDRGVSPVWDASVAYDKGRVQPYLRMTNLSNTGYQEILGVQMPGRAFVGGFEVVLGRR
jgi:iron complex outermembrane receptor protein